MNSGNTTTVLIKLFGPRKILKNITSYLQIKQPAVRVFIPWAVLLLTTSGGYIFVNQFKLPVKNTGKGKKYGRRLSVCLIVVDALAGVSPSAGPRIFATPDLPVKTPAKALKLSLPTFR